MFLCVICQVCSRPRSGFCVGEEKPSESRISREKERETFVLEALSRFIKQAGARQVVKKKGPKRPINQVKESESALKTTCEKLDRKGGEERRKSLTAGH